MSLIVSLKLFNTYGALVLTYMVFTLPYAILMLTGYFNTLPKDLDEAVMIDGGTRFKALWSVLVPPSVPGLVSVGMYTFMQAWNEYLFALALTKTNDMRTVPVDDGDECAWFSADFIPVPVLPEIFHCRYDGRIGKELEKE